MMDWVKIECGNFDCCLCLSMICGSQDGSSTPNELNCKGDNGCQGVGDMQIYGEKRYLTLIFVWSFNINVG